MTDENDGRAVGFLNRDRMTQAVIVGNTRRRDFAGIRACTQRDRSASECAEQAQGSMAIGRCSVCHRSVLVPHWSGGSVSVSDEAKVALVAANRFGAAGNAINLVDMGQQCRLGI